jgi:hypothetical protein
MAKNRDASENISANISTSRDCSCDANEFDDWVLATVRNDRALLAPSTMAEPTDSHGNGVEKPNTPIPMAIVKNAKPLKR